MQENLISPSRRTTWRLKLGNSDSKSPLTAKGGGARWKMVTTVNGELGRWVMMWKASRIFLSINFLIQSMAVENWFPQQMTVTRGG